MSHFRCDYLRLFPSPGPDELFNHDTSLGLISKNAPYRTSLQAAIWKKATFEALLKPGENPWQFEINSPERSKQFLFLSVLLNKDLHIKKQIFPITYHYLTAVLKGKWVYSMKQTLKNEGIVIDEKTRKIESYKEKVYSKIYNSVPLFIKKILDYITKLRN